MNVETTVEMQRSLIQWTVWEFQFPKQRQQQHNPEASTTSSEGKVLTLSVTVSPHRMQVKLLERMPLAAEGHLDVMPVYVLSEGAGPGAQVPTDLTRIPIPLIDISADHSNKLVKGKVICKGPLMSLAADDFVLKTVIQEEDSQPDASSQNQSINVVLFGAMAKHFNQAGSQGDVVVASGFTVAKSSTVDEDKLHPCNLLLSGDDACLYVSTCINLSLVYCIWKIYDEFITSHRFKPNNSIREVKNQRNLDKHFDIMSSSICGVYAVVTVHYKYIIETFVHISVFVPQVSRLTPLPDPISPLANKRNATLSTEITMVALKCKPRQHFTTARQQLIQHDSNSHNATAIHTTQQQITQHNSIGETETERVSRRTKVPKYTYVPLGDLKAGSVVNVYGVVVFFKQPFKSRGTDFCSSLKITDQSNQKIGCTIFCEKLEDHPKIYQIGDIVRMHRVKTQFFNNSITLVNTFGFAVVAFDGAVGGAVEPRTSSRSFHFDQEDRRTVEELRSWAASQTLLPPVCTIPLSAVQPKAYFDLTCQLLAKAPVDTTCTLLRVWDGTRCPRTLLNVMVERDVTEGPSSFSKAKEKLIANVLVYDNHMEFAGQLKPGDFLRIYNLRAIPGSSKVPGLTSSQSEEVDHLAFHLHGGTAYGRGIRVLPENSSEVQELKRALEAFPDNDEDALSDSELLEIWSTPPESLDGDTVECSSGSTLEETSRLAAGYHNIVPVKSSDGHLALLDLSAPFLFRGRKRFYGCKRCSEAAVREPSAEGVQVIDEKIVAE
ncbi:hypothetical protein F2P81_006334, partial [Scophthalmus maximus]